MALRIQSRDLPLTFSSIVLRLTGSGCWDWRNSDTRCMRIVGFHTAPAGMEGVFHAQVIACVSGSDSSESSHAIGRLR